MPAFQRYDYAPLASAGGFRGNPFGTLEKSGVATESSMISDQNGIG
jgi:hypothetical protein